MGSPKIILPKVLNNENLREFTYILTLDEFEELEKRSDGAELSSYWVVSDSDDKLIATFTLLYIKSAFAENIDQKEWLDCLSRFNKEPLNYDERVFCLKFRKVEHTLTQNLFNNEFSN